MDGKRGALLVRLANEIIRKDNEKAQTYKSEEEQENQNPLSEINVKVLETTCGTSGAKLQESTYRNEAESTSRPYELQFAGVCTEKNINLNESFSDFGSDDSVKDPPYDQTSHDSSDSSSNSPSDSSDEKQDTEDIQKNLIHNNEPIQQKRGRKRQATPRGSFKATAKRLRNQGKAYLSNSSKNKKKIPERKMGMPCPERCKWKCFANITEEQRKNIFNAYWEIGNLQRQREFIFSSMTIIEPKYSYRPPTSKRACNNAFFFLVIEKKIRVCKPFFRSTLGITDRPIRTVISKRQDAPGGIIELDLRGKHGNHKKLDASIKEGIRNHINAIPCIDSHYCRADSSRQYIDGSKTVAELHRDYVTECQSNNQAFGNYVLFHRIFYSEYNLAFFQPKKDQCEDCTAYTNAIDEIKEQLKPNYEKHLHEKTLSRQENKRHKIPADIGQVVAVYDLQATLPCPRGDVSNFYYVSKINTFNFTVYDLKSNDVDCFVWHEGEANRGVNEIGSCVYKFLEGLQEKTKDGKKLDVIFYSDNCCGQQKNHFMVALYLHAVAKFNFIKSISHKFLIKGHTQNEGDSAHSLIERRIKKALKSGPIFTPDQYIHLIRTAKQNKNPYKVHEMTHNSFYDLKELAASIGKKFSKNIYKETVKLTDIKIIRVQCDSPAAFFYKNSYTDTDFKKVEVDKPFTRSSTRSESTMSSKTNLVTLKKAYKHSLPISEKKERPIDKSN